MKKHGIYKQQGFAKYATSWQNFDTEYAFLKMLQIWDYFVRYINDCTLPLKEWAKNI